VSLADYFVNAAFQRELLRVLNRDEAVDALMRAIYNGRVAPAQARRTDEMQAVAQLESSTASASQFADVRRIRPRLPFTRMRCGTV
jgi:hypothetical protein